jgi:hypothetical protein
MAATKMDDKEKWVRIEEFPTYAVSNHGRVMNTTSDLIKVPSANQQGIPSVLLMKDRVQYRRVVSRLVAEHFIPNKKVHFNTPINLDGDRFNNYWKNLEWRPKWFAMAYHHQFQQPIPFGFSAGVYCVETNMAFDDVTEAAQEYGLLIKDIIHSTQSQTPVFPTWQTFGVVQK